MGCLSAGGGYNDLALLDTYIIDELKRRERERQQRERQRPSVEIPLVRDDEEDRRSEREELPSGGTVVQIDF